MTTKLGVTEEPVEFCLRFSTWVAILILTFFARGSDSAVAGVLDGLVLHIEFEDDVLDTSPSGYDGQSSGGLQYGPGVIGQAAQFDGIDDQVLFPTFEDALISQNDFTIAYWFNVAPGGSLSVLGKREVCGLSAFIDIRRNRFGEMGLEVSSPAQNYVVAVPATPLEWHHVAFTRTGALLEAFLDGLFVDMETTNGSIDFTNTAVLGLSNSPCVGADITRMMEGQIDDLRIYGRVLTDLEIASLGGLFADGFESGDTSAWSNTVP